MNAYNVKLYNGTEIYIKKYDNTWYNTTAITVEEYQCDDKTKTEVYHKSNSNKGDELYNIIKQEYDKIFEEDKIKWKK